MQMQKSQSQHKKDHKTIARIRINAITLMVLRITLLITVVLLDTENTSNTNTPNLYQQQ